MSVLTKPVRFTAQKQQELISRNQFQERLVEFGWKPTVPKDLGEDIIVDIYFQGRATGVNFYVQLKSVTNLNARRKGDDLVYPFEVKDLKHWETFELPVVLVVWDVGLREGRWALVGTAIAELDRRRPQWRSNKTKTRVRIPWNNTTDDTGLVQLWQAIGHHLYPLLARDKPLDIKVELSFPHTQEGTFSCQIRDESISTKDWRFVDRLGTIQDKIGQSLQLPIEGPTAQDVRAIDELVAIVERGKTVKEYVEATVKLKGLALDIVLDVARQGERIHLSLSYDESHVNLFGSEIQTGCMTRDITGQFEMSATELERAIAKLSPDEFLPVKLVDAEVIEIFPDWYIREAQRLSQHLVDDFGAKSVYLFGSLAWGDVYAPETDIDLAASGLPAEL